MLCGFPERIPMKFKNDVPFLPVGLEQSQLSFSGGRLLASIANHGGFTHIDYFGEQRFGDTRLFTGDPISAWGQLFRLCLSVDGALYYLDFQQTSIYPFGYRSQSTFNGVTVRHELLLLNDALVQRIKILRNPKKRKVSVAVFFMGHTRVRKPTRKWTGFEAISPENIFEGAAIDRHSEVAAAGSQFSMGFKTEQVMDSETYVALTADQPLRFMQPNEMKQNLHTGFFKDELTLSIVFGHSDHNRFLKRVREIKRTAGLEADRMLAAHERNLRKPSITLSNKPVQSFLANTRSMMDAMKIKDFPGGIRAANSGYWIWGWDSLVYSHVHGLLRDNSFGIEMLEFFKEHSDPEIGLFHSMTLDRKPFLAMAFNAQCLYAVVLYDVYLQGGDKAVLRAYFDFAKGLVDRAGRDEVGATGLVHGFSIYPDAVATLGETGEDISAMNNSIYFQALRAMEALARELGREVEAEDLKRRGDRLLTNFDRFYDPKQGFFYTSISSRDFQPRPHYGAHSVFWITPFARELVASHVAPIARFMRKHLWMKHGFRLMPTWDLGYMRDGCNNGYYDPYVERFYSEMMKMTRSEGGIAHFLSNVQWFWDQLNVPEAMTAEMENHGITVDCPGRQQLFGAKVWYSIFFHTLAGIELDCEGLSFSACRMEEIAIRDLQIRGYGLDIKITGRGWKIERLLLNGKIIPAPFKIPFRDLKRKNIISLRRK